MQKKPIVDSLPESAVSNFYMNDESIDDIRIRVLEDIANVYPVFIRAYDQAAQNEDFYRGRIWSENDKEAHAKQYRRAYQFNDIINKIDHILGIHASTKLSPTLIPVEPGDAENVKILQRILKWSEQINDLIKVEHEVFKDAVIGGVGASVVSWSFDGVKDGYPKVERIAPQQLIWDISSIEPDLSDCHWMARVMPMRRSAAMATYPEHREAVETASLRSPYLLEVYQHMTPNQIDDSRTVYFRHRDQDMVIVVEHYERVPLEEWVVTNYHTGASQEFTTIEEAEEYRDAIMNEYADSPIPLFTAWGDPTVVIAPVSRDLYVQTVVIGDQVVSRRATDLVAFPYQVCFAYFYQGQYWSPVEQMIDPQIFLSRAISEWENQVGHANKQFRTVIKALLHRDTTMDKLSVELSKTGGMLTVADHDAIRLHPNQPASPDFMNMIQFARGFILDAAGGANALGLQDNAAESGAAVKARQAAAGTSRIEMFDNLRRWRKSVAENLLWYLKSFLSPGQVLRVIGEDGEFSFFELDDSIIDSIRDIRQDVVVTDTKSSETARQEQYQQLVELLSVLGPTMPPESYMPFLVELSTLDPDVKRALIGTNEAYKEYQKQKMAMAEEEENQRQAEKFVKRAQIRAELKEKAEIETGGPAANPPEPVEPEPPAEQQQPQ
jgi:hypothetical protein